MRLTLPLSPELKNKLRVVLLHRIKMGISTYVSPAVLEGLDLKLQDDPWLNQIIIKIRYDLTGGREIVENRNPISYPCNWWQAVRQRWFPQWWLDVYPVQRETHYTSIHHRHVCPHLEYAWQNGCPETSHLAFLDDDPKHND